MQQLYLLTQEPLFRTKNVSEEGTEQNQRKVHRILITQSIQLHRHIIYSAHVTPLNEFYRTALMS